MNFEKKSHFCEENYDNNINTYLNEFFITDAHEK